MLLKEIYNVLALEKEKMMVGTISVNFEAQELGSCSQITKLEVLRQVLH